MPIQKRFPDRGPKQPGPADYEIPSKIVEGPIFTTRPKPPIDPLKCRTKPGPGEYNPPSDAAYKKLGYSIRSMNNVQPKSARQKELNPPGPGAYEDMRQLHYSRLPGSKVGSDHRNSYFLRTSLSGNPEPGVYNKPGLGEKNNQPKFSFSRSSRPQALCRGPPGPGEYEPE